jgi:hypothetical protein
MPDSTPNPACRPARRWEPIGLLGLSALVAGVLWVSWLRWPDPLVDFGRELYLPWRLSNGAVLYRDADDFYGPLSQYLNAALFRVFGPGLIVLVVANTAVFLGILAAVYLIIRRSWGAAAALVCASVFAAVFGFSQYISRGNYDFATPYSHEATHGLLTCVLLVLALGRWLSRPSAGAAFASGLLLGLAAVLKPEILLAAGAATVAAAAVRLARRPPIPWREGVPWFAGALAPTAAFWALFARTETPGRAFSYACRAWLSVVGPSTKVDQVIQERFLGLDKPWPHLLEHARCTLAAFLLFAAMAAAAWLSARAVPAAARAALWLAAVGGPVWLAWGSIDWVHVGRCLLGLVVAYACFLGARVFRRTRAPEAADEARLVFAVLAVALMARMILYGRIYHFGFYQAAMAAVLVMAVLVGEVPRLLPARGRALFLVSALALVGTGTGLLVANSRAKFQAKTLQVGTGRDTFYAFPERLDPTGELVRLVCGDLKAVPGGSTLLVLPEGEMINYLARMPSPVAPFFFFSSATTNGREKEIVGQLKEHHPDYIVIISRDLREYGIGTYGSNPGQGQEIMDWVGDHYQLVTSYGGNPLDSSEIGAVILSWQN